MTTPISPSTPPIGGGPSLGPTPLSTPTSGNFATDGLSAYSADIAAGNKLTIKDFSRIVLSATNENNATLWNSQQFNAARRKDFYLALVLDGLAALELLGRQVKGAESYRTKVSDNQVFVDFLNNNILNYNDNLKPIAQPSIDTLNQAIDDYNNGDITIDELNDAIDFYNNDVSYYNSQIDDFNLQVASFNEQAEETNETIAALNAERSAGTPPYEGQDLYTATPPYMPTAPHVTGSESGNIPHVSFTPPTLSYATNTMSPPSADVDTLIQFLNTNYETFLKNQVGLTTQILESQSTHEGFVQFYLQGTIPLLPAAFYTPAARPNLSGGGSGESAGGAGGAGAGISLSTIIASLSNPAVNAIIEQSIFAADTHLQSLPLTPAAVMQLQFQSLSLLQNIGLQAGSLAVRLLVDRLPFVDIRSSPVSVASGLTLASEIALGVSSGAVANGVKEALAKAYPELDPAKRDALASQLTTALELVFLQSAVFQLAQALKSPQLSGQVLGSLTSAQELGLTSDNTVNPNTEALRNALARNLANRLNTSYNDALPLISNSVIAAATENPYNNQTIIDELVNNEIPLQVAINTANYSQAYLKAENLGRGQLDQTVSSERLNQSILSNQLVAQIVAGKPEMTNRELRDQLAQQFVNSGNTQENALLGATLAVVGNGGISATNPEALRSSLQQTATARLAGLGNSSTETNSIANDLISTVLGPSIPGSQTSIRDLIDERLQGVLKSNDANLINAVKANLTQFLEPTVELYSFADALRDPANTFLLCAQTGLMYNHQQPSNYIKSVDIIV